MAAANNVYAVPHALTFKGWADLARQEREATRSKRASRLIKESGRNPRVLEKKFVLRNAGGSSVPIVIVPPRTKRFKLAFAQQHRTADPSRAPGGAGAGAAAAAAVARHAPLTPLLSAGGALPYILRFLPPTKMEEDYLWDNFVDEIVVHTRTCRTKVSLTAVKEVPHGDAGAGAAGAGARARAGAGGRSVEFFPSAAELARTEPPPPTEREFAAIEAAAREAKRQQEAATHQRWQEQEQEQAQGRGQGGGVATRSMCLPEIFGGSTACCSSTPRPSEGCGADDDAADAFPAGRDGGGHGGAAMDGTRSHARRPVMRVDDADLAASIITRMRANFSASQSMAVPAARPGTAGSIESLEEFDALIVHARQEERAVRATQGEAFGAEHALGQGSLRSGEGTEPRALEPDDDAAFYNSLIKSGHRERLDKQRAKPAAASGFCASSGPAFEQYMKQLERREGEKRPAKSWTELPTWCRIAQRKSPGVARPAQGSASAAADVAHRRGGGGGSAAEDSGGDDRGHDIASLESLDPAFYGTRGTQQKNERTKASAGAGHACDGYGRSFVAEVDARKAADEREFWAVLPSSPATHSPKQPLGQDDEDLDFYLSLRRPEKKEAGNEVQNLRSPAAGAAELDGGDPGAAPIVTGAAEAEARISAFDDSSIVDEYARRKRAAMAAILREQGSDTLALR